MERLEKLNKFLSDWKEASFGWIPKRLYFDLKIIAMLAAYSFAIMFQAEDRILTAVVKLVAFSLLYRLFKKWFAERLTMKEFLSRMKPNKNYAGTKSISPLAAELDVFVESTKNRRECRR
jgi:hypothetical protein